MADADGRLERLESRRTTLFFVAAGVLAVFATNTVLEAFAGTSYPVIQSFVGPAGFFVGVLGLFSLYPTLADETPRLARLAAAVAALPLVGWFLVILMSLGEAAGVAGPPSGPLVVIPIGTIATTMLAYGLFGGTILGSDVPTRIVGAFLLVPAIMFVLLISRTTAPFIIDLGHFTGHLGAALTLWARGIPTDQTEPAADAAT